MLSDAIPTNTIHSSLTTPTTTDITPSSTASRVINPFAASFSTCVNLAFQSLEGIDDVTVTSTAVAVKQNSTSEDELVISVTLVPSAILVGVLVALIVLVMLVVYWRRRKNSYTTSTNK